MLRYKKVTAQQRYVHRLQAQNYYVRSMLRSDSAGLQRLSQNCAAEHNKLVEF